MHLGINGTYYVLDTSQVGWLLALEAGRRADPCGTCIQVPPHNVGWSRCELAVSEGV